MKKAAMLGLIICLGVNGLSAECKLFMKPSDFQLDTKLIAPNESKFFSNVGNKMQRHYLFGTASGFFCAGIIADSNPEKTRACVNELYQLSEEDTFKFNKQAIAVTNNSVEADGQENMLYGFKTSANAPISEKHLCYLQKKYGDKIIPKLHFMIKEVELKTSQNKVKNQYLEIAEKVGMSEDMTTIGQAFVNEN